MSSVCVECVCVSVCVECVCVCVCVCVRVHDFMTSVYTSHVRATVCVGVCGSSMQATPPPLLQSSPLSLSFSRCAFSPTLRIWGVIG